VPHRGPDRQGTRPGRARAPCHVLRGADPPRRVPGFTHEGTCLSGRTSSRAYRRTRVDTARLSEGIHAMREGVRGEPMGARTRDAQELHRGKELPRLRGAHGPRGRCAVHEAHRSRRLRREHLVQAYERLSHPCARSPCAGTPRRSRAAVSHGWARASSRLERIPLQTADSFGREPLCALHPGEARDSASAGTRAEGTLGDPCPRPSLPTRPGISACLVVPL
jgi:hypothetical protein